MSASDLVTEVKALNLYASEIRSDFWIKRCEALLTSIDQIEAAADCLFFASLKNALEQWVDGKAQPSLALRV